MGYTHSMKAIADDRRRVTMPKSVESGDVFDIVEPENGRYVLIKLTKPRRPKARLVRDDEGILVAHGTGKITNEMVRKALADFP